MLFAFQILIYLIFFTASIKLLVLNDPVRGIFFYPKERCIFPWRQDLQNLRSCSERIEVKGLNMRILILKETALSDISQNPKRVTAKR